MAIKWSGSDKQFLQVEGRGPDRVGMDLIDGLFDETFHLLRMGGYMSGKYMGYPIIGGAFYETGDDKEQDIGYHIINEKGNFVAELELELIVEEKIQWYRTTNRLLFMVSGNFHRPDGVTGFYRGQLDISHDVMTLLWETCDIIIEQHQLNRSNNELAEAEVRLSSRLQALRDGRAELLSTGEDDLE